MTTKLVAALLISFVIAVIFGRFLVPWLRKIKAGQSIREDGPIWHMSKSGTPTMGGVIFIVSITITCLTVGFQELENGDYAHLFILAFALIYGMIGFLDDYEKLRKKQNLGLTASKKFLLQLAVAVAFVVLLRNFGYLNSHLYVPFFNVILDIPEPLYFVFAAFVIVATVNSVNITDGADGLATGTTLPVAICYSAIAFCWGERYTGTGIFAAALTGGLIGFLVYNYYPAKIFMGDTGSLFLGGAVCALAFVYDMPLILIPLGMVYLLETLSDIIQIVYFKATGGKRIFKMAPFHHHLEMGGWSKRKWTEKEIFSLFTAVSSVFAIVSFFAVYQRYY